jgi:tetratricopeptide (TPR) repeat protein
MSFGISSKMKRRRTYLKRITLENRILLLLRRFDRFRESFTVPEVLSQGGMAKTLAARQNHVSRAITDLESKGMVNHRSAHVKGLSRKRRVYFLNRKGLEETDRYITGISSKYLTVRTAEGSIEEWDLKRAVRTVSNILERNVDMFEMVNDLIENNELDLTIIGGEDLHRTRMERTIPKVKEFYGRDEELESMENSVNDQANRMISIISIAGQGKTSLISKFLENEKRVIWTSCNTYMGQNNFLNELSMGLRSLGSGSLFSYMTSEGRLDTYDSVRVAIDDLNTTGATLVIEDLHKAPDDLMELFKVMKELMVEGKKKVKVIISSRIRPPIYSRTEVTLRRELNEIQLEGLSLTEMGEMLSARNRSLENLERIYEITCGNPLALQLYLISDTANWEDARFSLDRFIQEEMVSQLTRPEWDALKLASLYRLPVYPKAFLNLDGVNEDTVKGLIDRMLLVQYPDGTCFLHELLKESVRDKVTPPELKNLSAKAFDYFRTRGADPDIMEAIHFATLAGKRQKARSYVIKYGEYLAARGYQQVWEIAGDIRDEDLESIDRVTKYLIGFENSLLKDDMEEAKRMLEKARNICDEGIQKKQDGDWNLALSRVLNRFGELARLEGVSEKAIKRYKESLAIMRDSNDQLGEAKALNNLGVAYMDREEVDTALRFFLDSEKILRSLDDMRGLTSVHLNMGNIKREMGKVKDAISFYEKAREEAISSGSKGLELEAMSKLADIHLQKGENEIAQNYLSSCISGYLEAGNHTGLGKCTTKAVSSYLELGQKKKASRLLGTIMKMWNRKGGLFYRRVAKDMKEEERSSYLMLTFYRSLVDDDIRKAPRDLKAYLNWCAVNLSGDRFLDRVIEIESLMKGLDVRWRNLLFETSVSSSSLFDGVEPQVVLLIRWAKRSGIDTSRKKTLLRKALKLSEEGGFESGEKRARKMLSSLK